MSQWMVFARKIKDTWWNPTSTWLNYGWATLMIAGVTLLNLLIDPWISSQAIGLTGLFAVFLVAVFWGRGPALLAATLSALAWNYLFLRPHYTFLISQTEDLLLFCLYFIIALLTGNLTARIRTQERQALYNADRTQALYRLAREMSAAVTFDDVLATAVAQIGQIFQAEIALVLPTANQQPAQAHPSSTLRLDQEGLAMANRVLAQGYPLGRFDQAHPSADVQHLPLLASGKRVGVLGIRLQQPAHFSNDQRLLLETFANQIALIIQRQVLDQTARQAALLRESERLYTSLLNSISHELRTPITTITGASSSLLDPQTSANPSARLELTQEIQGAAERLNRLIENLLDMSRLDAGRLQLKLEWCEIGDLIGVAVQRLTSELQQHRLQVVCPPDLPLVQLDFGLIEQVLVNLLDNACHYTPANTPIEVRARVEEQTMRIDVIDYGPGIPQAAQASLFDKFYRLPGTATGGIGLGLSICHGLVAAHGGNLSVQNHAKGGAQFTIRLPMRTAAPPVQEAMGEGVTR